MLQREKSIRVAAIRQIAILLKAASFAVFWGVVLLPAGLLLADERAEQFFESRIRPVLVEDCVRCHGPKKQSAGLRLDSREAMLAGGDTGPVLSLDNPAQSLLVQAVRHQNGLSMPPDQTLAEQKILALEQWIASGARWPEASMHLIPDSGELSADSPGDHWAFQPIKRPTIPKLPNGSGLRNPIDSFIRFRLTEEALSPSPVADRRTLIRRLSYSLTGLPPSAEEVEAFVADRDPLAYERLVERLLDSFHYGEQWARHWLDVARYSDTKGYVYAREERFWTHAWAYRDWVVNAFNQDMPYDRFLLLQLAADQVMPLQTQDFAAMGFMTLGRRFLGVRRDVIDDRIDVVCRGTMGLTVSCARCHDHKYDPIPAADYYSLYGVFDSCSEVLVPLQQEGTESEFGQGLAERQVAFKNKMATSRLEASERARDRVADYLFAQTELQKYPANGFDQIFQPDDLLPALVRRWEKFLRQMHLQDDPIFFIWHSLKEIPQDSFPGQAKQVLQKIRKLPASDIHPVIAKAFQDPPNDFREVCDRYAEVFTTVKQEWKEKVARAEKAGAPLPTSLGNPDLESLRKVLFGPQAPPEIPEGPISDLETCFDSATCTELWKLQGEIDRWIIRDEASVPFALTLRDMPTPVTPRIFRRGNPLDLGADVPRQFLSILAGETREPFRRGSGRLELAHAIIDPSNPLTARVIVNRIWAHHFGQGLVTTLSDFGRRAAPPSHPELLDWLACELIANDWSLKDLHRLIVMSAAFRQSSSGPSDQSRYRAAHQKDPANRLLWRANARRLTFEEFRDTLLSVTRDLDDSIGGKPAKLFEQPYPRRRTLYGLIDRQYLPGTLRVFDFANPDLHVPNRSETTVPQQALFFMNHPMVLEQAKQLSKCLDTEAPPRERVTKMFQRVFQRSPTPVEVAESLAFVAANDRDHESNTKRTSEAWSYGYGVVDESTERINHFTSLPHFTGQAWQGGHEFPDAKLGWVQLHAQGGHPGNDRNHAAVRRWTAPRRMTVRVASELIHEPTQGDGIRAFVISSNSGFSHSVNLHHETQSLDIQRMVVAKGDTIDFAVDIGNVLNSDQFLWKVKIHEVSKEGASENHDRVDDLDQTWDSVSDFPRPIMDQLDGWEQLAQVLICSNEYLFVD